MTKSPKPQKPRTDFPLTPHNNGKWCKKIKGKIYYFGEWSDPEGALQEYLCSVEAIRAGRPRHTSPSDQMTARELCNHFMVQSENRNIGQRQFNDLLSACDRIVKHTGDRVASDVRGHDLMPILNELDGKALSTKARVVRNVRSVFNYAANSGLIERPIPFGAFSAPSQTELRRERMDKKREHGDRLFTPQQCQQILRAAAPALKAMVLLTLNCGLSNSDLKTIRTSDYNPATGVLDYFRRKKATERRAILWRETLEALAEYLKVRPKPKQKIHREFVFITKYGNTWGTPDKPDCPISKKFSKLLTAIKLKRAGLSYYSLRHTHRTISDEAADPSASARIMGHVDASMSGVYLQSIADARLKAVSDHIHRWLFENTQ